MHVLRLGLIILVAGLAVPLWAAAQPAIGQGADEQFRSALVAFESGEYGPAYTGFMEVFNRQPEHPKTTAALLMAGKALYRMGDYSEALNLLEKFHSTYSTSQYLEEASRLMAYARLEQGNELLRLDAINVGVALPLTGADPVLTRSLFNGIRLAVDQHNARGQRMVRLIYRDTQNSAQQARRAVADLIAQGAEVIIGPLFSREVLAAAEVADRAGVVMVAPLATDKGITRGRRHVFQANAILEDQGAFMARAAVSELGLESFGVVSLERDAVSTARARGFAEAAYRSRATIAFEVPLQSSSDWLRLPELIGIAQLAEVDGLYLSVEAGSEQDVVRLVEGVLERLGRIPSAPHVLGASAWNDLELGVFAQRLDVSYVDVYHVNELSNEVRNFKHAFREMSQGNAPDRLAFIGYDVARMLLQYVGTAEDLASTLRGGTQFEGVATRIRFDRDQRNRTLFLFNHSPNGGILVN